MGQTLENGVYLPSEGERNCYAGLKTNWEILDQKVADVTALQQAVAGALHRQIVASLPTTDIDPNTIYMVLSGTSATENVYNEFMYVNNAWELIGTSATDLTNYYTKVEVDGKLLLKANDSDVVHKSGNEVISGEKNFRNTSDYSGIKLEGTRVCHITADNANDGVLAPNNCSFSFLLPDSNKALHVGRWTSSNNRIFLDKSYPYMDLNGGILRSNTYVPTGETGTATLRLMAQLNFADDTNKTVDVRLTQYGSTASILYSNTDNVTSLGSTSKRWSKIYGTEYYYGSNNVEFSTKFVTTDTAQTISGNKTFSSINGVEPSSLSLPSGNVNDVIDISSYLVNLDGTDNTYVAPANGWITINMNNCSGIHATITGLWSDSRVRASAGAVKFLMPVLKNQTVTLTIHGGTINNARFIPCQGNV